jgi:Uma2 family endonuclease
VGTHGNRASDSIRFSPADFEELCFKNRNLHAELSSEGNLSLLAPTGKTSGWRNSKLTHQLETWTETHQTDGIRLVHRFSIA